MIFNHNVLAFILGMAIIGCGTTIAWLFQKKLFGRYRGKVSNAVNNKNQK